MSMFCYQCEQAARGTGCDKVGVCGKEPGPSALQDLLVQALKELGAVRTATRLDGLADPAADLALVEGLFATVTNVDFDPARLAGHVHQVVGHRDRLLAARREAGRPELPTTPTAVAADATIDALSTLGERFGIPAAQAHHGADAAALRELVVYGLKGMAAYVDHAERLGQRDDAVYAFVARALGTLLRDDLGVPDLLGLCLEVGGVNLRVMELLDAANTGTYGHPEPTRVRMSAVKGKAILVSGHDLKDLAELLEQTAGRGVNVYTHSEMLPANAYPALKKHAHLVGNYGGAWQDQQAEFDAFPGAVLMTTNCIQKPRDSYRGRIFTTGLVAWPGVTHVANGAFEPVIRAALEAPGFAADEPEAFVTVGFARNAVLGVADKVIDAVKAGAIRHFFLVGGCDGAKPGRNYYTELVEKTPKDTVVLTLACGKYRFNRLELGDIGGIPRLLDVGQCNDAYSAIRIALALADAFGTDVNSLPLSLVLSWYEQKAVAILLTLLHLGLKNIRLGPSLPAFVTPAVLDVLVTTFGLKPTTTADADLAAML
jgi:hydroxylamine reductase